MKREAVWLGMQECKHCVCVCVCVLGEGAFSGSVILRRRILPGEKGPLPFVAFAG